MSGEVEKCPILHVRPKFEVFTLDALHHVFRSTIFQSESDWDEIPSSWVEHVQHIKCLA